MFRRFPGESAEIQATFGGMKAIAYDPVNPVKKYFKRIQILP
jgi:hypothetical protein